MRSDCMLNCPLTTSNLQIGLLNCPFSLEFLPPGSLDRARDLPVGVLLVVLAVLLALSVRLVSIFIINLCWHRAPNKLSACLSLYFIPPKNRFCLVPYYCCHLAFIGFHLAFIWLSFGFHFAVILLSFCFLFAHLGFLFLSPCETGLLTRFPRIRVFALLPTGN